jgi:hypothetical protein
MSPTHCLSADFILTRVGLLISCIKNIYFHSVIDCMSIDFLNVGARCAPMRTKFVDIASNKQLQFIAFCDRYLVYG